MPLTLDPPRNEAQAPAARVRLPDSYNYIGAFLTFQCPYRCSYCINRFHEENALGYERRSGREWIAFFERLEVRDVPITLQGGEPGLHPDFIEIVQQVSRIHPVDILTNLAFDLDTFVRQVDPAALNRPAPYAPIRVSYHPEQFTLPDLLERVEILVSAGFRVGLYGVLHPDYEAVILEAQRQCIERGLDFRTKPFLGWHQGRLYGEYACPEACAGAPYKTCECAPSELLIAPDGSIHRCHYFLYCQKTALAQIGDPQIILPDDYLACPWLGACNPCDVKIKNNRFQQFGHIAARIRNIH